MQTLASGFVICEDDEVDQFSFFADWINLRILRMTELSLRVFPLGHALCRLFNSRSNFNNLFLFRVVLLVLAIGLCNMWLCWSTQVVYTRVSFCSPWSGTSFKSLFHSFLVKSLACTQARAMLHDTISNQAGWHQLLWPGSFSAACNTIRHLDLCHASVCVCLEGGGGGGGWPVIFLFLFLFLGFFSETPWGFLL